MARDDQEDHPIDDDDDIETVELEPMIGPDDPKTLQL